MKRPSPLAQDALVFLATFVYFVLRAPDPAFFLFNTDHGEFLAEAGAVLDGRWDGNLFFEYGPGGPLLGAAVMLFGRSPATELFLIAVAFATTFALAMNFMRRTTSPVVAAITVLALAALVPRLYKWFYWLFLVGILGWCVAYVETHATSRRLFLLVGWAMFHALAFFFRVDLFALSLVAMAAVVTPTAFADPGIPLARRLTRAAADILVPTALAGVLIGGYGALRCWDGSACGVLGDRFGVVGDTFNYSAAYALLQVDLQSPLSDRNLFLVLKTLMIGTYLVALLLFARDWLRHRRPPSPREALLIGAAVIGLASLAPILLMVNVITLFSVLPPFVIVVVLLGQRLFEEMSPSLGPERAAVLAALAVAALAAPLVPVSPHSGWELGSPLRHPLKVWSRIHNLPDSQPRHPVAEAALAVRRLTGPRDRIFLAMKKTMTPLLYFSGRPMSGLFVYYVPSALASRTARQNRNLAAIAAAPPKLLIVRRSEWPPVDPAAIPPYDAALVERWRNEYTHTVFENAEFLVLARPRE